ncbi:MAG: arginine--tRNA ligase [Patescibacteria group bacterium]
MLASEFLKSELEKLVKKNLPEAKLGDFSVSVSERPEFGDYTTNLAFVLAKQTKQSPFLVAEDTKKDLANLDKYFSKIEVKNGYINFFLSPDFLLKILETSPEKLLKAKKKKRVIIDYSSPNIGKQLSIAHIRSTIIGDALARIYGFLGWQVISDNHLGDWGMLAGRLIAAYKKYSKTSLAKLTIEQMNQLYVKFTGSEKDNPELTESAKQETVKLQNQDKENLAIWKALLKNSIKEFEKHYQLLGIRKFDYYHGESFYQKIAEKLVNDFQKKGWAESSQGAVIIDLADKSLPALMIQKSDQAFLYATNDLATIIYREKQFKPDLVLYVVANEQALYFEQLFTAVKKFNLAPKTKLVHVKFGMLLGQDKKKLSTRSGRSILLEEVLGQAISRAKKIAKHKNPELSEKRLNKIARIVGINAAKYNDLCQNRNTDIVFDWDKMLSLEGNSGPYLQYTYVRLSNILRRARFRKIKLAKKDLTLFSEDETAILRKLVQFPEAVKQSAEEYLPNLIASYVFELANLANSFYEKYPVLKAERKLRKARLILVFKVAETIKTCLSLFGIEVLDRI